MFVVKVKFSRNKMQLPCLFAFCGFDLGQSLILMGGHGKTRTLTIWAFHIFCATAVSAVIIIIRTHIRTGHISVPPVRLYMTNDCQALTFGRKVAPARWLTNHSSSYSTDFPSPSHFLHAIFPFDLW